jgi:predicted aspartyl protease
MFAIGLTLYFGGTADARGLLIFGTSVEGGGANKFEKIIDFDNGHERTREFRGPASMWHGFDGQLWISLNGTTNTVDLPSEVSDERAEMWVGQEAWQLRGKLHEHQRKVSLSGVSQIELEFDPETRRVRSATIEEDYGPVTISFSQWRGLDGRAYPFRQERVAGPGDRTVEVARSVRIIDHVDPNLLARPQVPALDRLGQPVVTVPFEAVGNGKSHTQVLASVNGDPAEFIFDTGAANILTIEAAKRLGIAASGGINIGGVGEGTEGGGFGLVHEVAIGNAMLFDQSFMVIPSPFPSSNGKPSPIAGLLGYEFLAKFVTTIDYSAHTITFRRRLPVHQQGVRFPFVTDGHTINIAAVVDGKSALFRLDTGDGGTVTLFPAYAAAAGFQRRDSTETTVGAGAGGLVRGRRGKVDDFSLGGLHFHGLPVDFSENSQGAFASRHLAGNIGARVLGCFRITFDYPHHQLWLEPQPDPPQCALAITSPNSARNPSSLMRPPTASVISRDH